MSDSDREPRLGSIGERSAEVLDRPILGQSVPVLALHDLITKAARADSSVLIIGETGVGKARVARSLHQGSTRAAGPFVPVNCSAVTETLLEAELFGHVRGAFTGAVRDRAGLFVAARSGTLFLDEIGDLPEHVQPKLLRALESRQVRPVGADREVPFDARVIAATNRPVELLLAERRLREDLFYRLAVICIDVPPLRERGDDALLIARHFLAELGRRADAGGSGRVLALSPEAEHWIRSYSWPGNVRELKNCIERAVVLSSGLVVDVADLVNRATPPAGVERASSPRTFSEDAESAPVPDGRNDTSTALPQGLIRPGIVPMRDLRESALRQVLQLTGGNRAAAARLLGISRRTVHRWLKGSSGTRPT